MTIQEAIKSGKPFKRRNNPENDWLSVGSNEEIKFVDPKEQERACGVPMWKDDFFATDCCL